ncbi:MAG: hypothetical protein LC802_18305 [Acidobacteria bacterium]|nr:hypothetical protein [Acidobacteriota bacterium]
MKLYDGKRRRSLWLFMLTLLCVSSFTNRAFAQCCCGGVHVSVYGKNKKPITPVVTALVGLEKRGETMLPRLIEPQVGDKASRTIRVSADCYGFSLMEITVAHKGERMVLRLRDLPFGELGDIYLEPLAFRRGTSEIDFKGQLKGNCKEKAEDFRCVIPSARWRKVSERAEAELAPPRAQSDSH